MHTLTKVKNLLLVNLSLNGLSLKHINSKTQICSVIKHVLAFALILISAAAKANEPQTSNETETVVIETKVTGTQEQPKVLYIMPWQGITHPVSINDNDLLLSLPQFKPINPKTFKKQLRDFSNNQQQQTTEK